MNITRRQFVFGAGASAAIMHLPVAKAALNNPQTIDLQAITGATQLLPEKYPKTPIWGYGGMAPGPTLRVRQGEKLVCNFINDLPQASTVHWHGIRIDNKMDGVPDLTQALVPSKGQFRYEFVAPDAGTFWYHPHNKTSEQMARGLYGALIVEEKSPPEVDQDEVLMIDDWRLGQSGQIDDSFGAMMDWSHGGRLGNWITVNGNARYQKPVKQNERLRLRLINTSNARIFSLLLNGLEGWVVALDGQPIETPFEESKPLDRLSLAPAQRIDLIVDVTAEEGTEGVLYMPGRNGDHTLAVFSVDGKARPAPLPTPKPLARNPIPEIDSAAQARKVFLHMEGGAMGQMRGAFLGGKRVGMRELVNAGKVWAFNGQVEMPEKPLISAARGETLHIEIKNDTSWPHAMHLHGFHFRKLAENGRFGPLRDTLLMDREETATIAFVADNPGKWLLHCHMLEHVSSGMMTWIEVA